MRLIKLALISAIVLFAIVTGMSLIIPSHITLTKLVTVKPEKDTIFSLVKNKDQWPRWHPSFKNSQQTALLSTVTTKTISETDSVLTTTWQQQGKKPLEMRWQIEPSPIADSAVLVWNIDFHLSWYPWQKLGSLFYERSYGTMMEQGLLNIKNELEKDSTKK